MIRPTALATLLAFACAAQTNTATITGVITDATGAVVTTATVTVRSIETGITAEVASNEAGVYTAPSLNIGRYEVSVRASGFKSQVVSGIELSIGQRLRQDFKLELGNVAEAIEVRAEAAPLQQETAEISDTITTQEVIGIPLPNREPYAVLALSAGVIGRGKGADLDYNQNVSINGSRVSGNAFLVDGAYVMNQGGIGERVTSIEALQEVKVLASTYSAEFGRS
jgi:hypothetical protein